ncbi:Anucleate primary sterigmata protein B [Fulvia fulva]|uniref:Anucleate primary sterigmata protein B n=1 Tax=Passalora fulva TaxID=5499 RepID=A0A9Q8PJJ3_PASFU|nr:Anucleate primary sterigmata protein B [Fulvia fulva]KAK4612169.1 Anucleate primary sterigmata protein B [Fulvia fulva]KAK4613161.1 Anucleate primary sterigmata protein B [Fulvia fulva]UJO23655.1 Anucleate primary sterigmata protein B [Fulvia fulva]WPV21255.1 Anucleate primary sterigmata protein B [Fulvia fulva]WPV35766.1 Anucleate primary sterigmata protein B [Fulvia fulva]
MDSVVEPYASIMDVVSPARPASSSGTAALSLKEQNQRVDALSKENFDLKLKITFLEDAIHTRSHDGVEELVQQNVELRTELAHERRDAQAMRRKIKTIEQMNEKQADKLRLAQLQNASREDDDDPVLQADMHEEILYLRQQLHRSEDTITALRDEVTHREKEKHKMVDHVRSMANKQNHDASTINAAQMWQAMLNEEATRRETAEQEATDLRNQLARMKIKHSAAKKQPILGNYRARSRSTSRPRSDAEVEEELVNQLVEGEPPKSLNELKQEITELQEQNTELKHNNAELKRDLAAQTSMLTSRNRERERLQQQIEDLKLLQPHGARSVAGEGIFERSISRAHQRSQSRISDQTAVTEAERDDFHKKEGQLRDQLAELRIKYQELDRQHKTYLQYASALEDDFKEMETELHDHQEEIQSLQKERDDAIARNQEREQFHEDLKRRALDEINAIDEENNELEQQLEQADTQLQETQLKLQSTVDDYQGLQSELRSITQSVMSLEDLKKHNMRQIESLEQHIADAEDENRKWEETCTELRTKNRQLEVAQESLNSEVTFLREEQEGDKIKIGELENALNAAQQTIQDEQEKLHELENKMTEEREQRDVLENQSKEEVQKILDDLNTDGQKTKDEVRKLRRDLSGKEVECGGYKQRLDDLEQSLRDILGEPNGTKRSMLSSIEKLQRELETSLNHADKIKMDLADKERLLRHRDGLLENTSLESRRLSDLLDKERSSRKRDLEQFEKSSRGTAQQMRTIAQHETHIMELETSLTQVKRKSETLGQTYQEQLSERNNLLLALWNRLSTLCGSDWAQNHSLVEGELPSAEAINKNLGAFNKNVISAVKTIEALLGSFKVRIRTIEKDLWKDYQTLEHNLDIRIRRMDLLENAVDDAQRAIAEQAARRPEPSRTLSTKSVKNNEEFIKLKNEVKLLKTELKFHRQHPSAIAQQLVNQHQQTNVDHARTLSSGSPARQIVSQLLRHHSTSAVEQVEASPQQIVVSSPAIQPSELRWTHRLRELERRLKAEREARLLDRRGARQRLEQAGAENEELREALDRVRADGEVNESEE